MNRLTPMPAFPSETRTTLLVKRGDGSPEPATIDDVIKACLELPESQQDIIATAICPSLQTRLERAEEIVQSVANLNELVKKSRKHVDDTTPF